MTNKNDDGSGYVHPQHDFNRVSGDGHLDPQLTIFVSWEEINEAVEEAKGKVEWSDWTDGNI